jgi:formylglycine-generating enzyme required for sulfatase activity
MEKLFLISFILFIGCSSKSQKPSIQKKVIWKKSAMVDKKGNPLIFPKNAWVYIEPKSFFKMGEKKGRIDQGPVRQVKISKGYFILKKEVTQHQWVILNKSNLSKFKTRKDCQDHTKYNNEIQACPNNPVENVSWEEIQRLVNILNQFSKDYVYRLPTEAEFEYAMRGGTTTQFFFGDDEKNLAKYVWPTNSPKKTSSVGKKKPNPFGLYDMAGNVWEWTLDGYDKFFYEAQVNRINPQGYFPSKAKVIRGGGWNSKTAHFKSSYRGSFSPNGRSPDLGFRLIRIKK